MKPLYLSFAPPEKWRNQSQSRKLKGEEWKALRQKILVRDNFTCSYCGYKSEKYQIADHIDGNPENNGDNNLQLICQMCNLIKHSGQGCIVQDIVELYAESKYVQNDIIRITMEMRDKGSTDDEIIKFLGLKNKVSFMMDMEYLRKLFGFVTSRQSKAGDMYNNWLNYHKRYNSRKSGQKSGLKKFF